VFNCPTVVALIAPINSGVVAAADNPKTSMATITSTNVKSASLIGIRRALRDRI